MHGETIELPEQRTFTTGPPSAQRRLTDPEASICVTGRKPSCPGRPGCCQEPAGDLTSLAQSFNDGEEFLLDATVKQPQDGTLWPSGRGYLRDEGAGQEAHQADGGATHSSDPAAQNVCEDADDGRAEEDHPHGERAHPC